MLFLIVAAPVYADSCREIEARLANDFRRNAVEILGEQMAKPKSILSESELLDAYPTRISTIVKEGEEGHFLGTDGVKIGYLKLLHPNERAAIVLTPGLKESYLTYQELIRALHDEGYSVYAMDPRGQGKSERLAPNPQVVHTTNFDNYIDDANHFVKSIVKRDPHAHVFGIGTSMGGLITTLHAKDHPKNFDAFVAVAPAYRINLRGFPRWAANAILKIQMARGKEKEYSLFQGDLKPDFSNLYPGTQSRVRAGIIEDGLRDYPEIVTGGASYGWLNSALKANDRAMSDPKAVETPKLILSPTNDSIVHPWASEKFSKSSPHSSFLSVEGAKHSLMLEADRYRDPALIDAFRFLINPRPLSKPHGENELGNIVRDAKAYKLKGEPAFARYALDEAVRVYEAKRSFYPEWENPQKKADLRDLSDFYWEEISKADPAQQALYLYLSERRAEELKNSY